MRPAHAGPHYEYIIGVAFRYCPRVGTLLSQETTVRHLRRGLLFVIALILLSPPGPADAGGGEVLISFIDARHGWVGFPRTASTRLLATADGGRSWSASNAPVIGTDVHFADRRHGWIAGSTPQCAAGPPPACHWTLLKTDDGGRTWHQQLNPAPGHFFTPGVFQVLDARHVVVGDLPLEGCCSPTLLWSTSDGGRSWRQSQTRGTVSSVDFVSARDGWIGLDTPGGCGGGIDVTRDGGRTFHPQMRLTRECGVLLDFVSLREGWALTTTHMGCNLVRCLRYILYHTDDGGVRWTVLQRQGGLHAAWLLGAVLTTALHFATAKAGWIAFDAVGSGSRGGIAYTSDGGSHWHPHYLASAHLGIALVDARHGWLMGCSYAGACVVQRTGDGGRTLTVMSLK